MRLPTFPAICFYSVVLLCANLPAQDDSRFITFLTPQGGEVYVIDQVQKLHISSPCKTLNLALSRDGGKTFEEIGTLSGASKAHGGVFTWTVTGPGTPNAVIRASCVRSGQTISTTSAAFAITLGSIFDASASGAPFVLKAGDTMTGALQINAPNTGLTVANNASIQGLAAIGANAPVNAVLSVGATLNSFNVAVRDSNPSMLLSDTGTGDTGGFFQFRDADETTRRAQIAAFSPSHSTRPNWFYMKNFKAGPLVLGTNNLERVYIDSAGNTGIGTLAPNSLLHVSGSFALPIRTTALVSDTLTAADYVLVSNSAAAATIQLPSAVNITGRIYIVKNRSASGTVTLAASAQTIDGNAQIAIAPGAVACVQSDGTNWIKIN